MHYLQYNPKMNHIITSTETSVWFLNRLLNPFNSFYMCALTAVGHRKIRHTGRVILKALQQCLHSSLLMQSEDSCFSKPWEHGNERKVVLLVQLRPTLPMLSPTDIPICAHHCLHDPCAQAGWALRGILGGMKALSSLAGYDIIIHSAQKVMTGSNPYRINAFMKTPLFP